MRLIKTMNPRGLLFFFPLNRSPFNLSIESYISNVLPVVLHAAPVFAGPQAWSGMVVGQRYLIGGISSVGLGDDVATPVKQLTQGQIERKRNGRGL